MTISTSASKLVAQGNGATTVFSYSFLIPSASEAVVSVVSVIGAATQLTPSQYTLTGIGDPNGGTLTYPVSGSPLPIGSSIVLRRVMPLQQQTKLTGQSNYRPDVVEGALDTLELQIQQIDDEAGSAIHFPVVDSEAINSTLPSAAARANQLVSFDSSGGVIAVAPVAGTATALAIQLASGVGAAQIGYQPSAISSALATLAAILGGFAFFLDNFIGYDPTGVTDSAAAFQAAANAASLIGGAKVFVPIGTHAIGTFAPQSNVTFQGVPGASWIKQIQPGTNTQTGIYKAAGAGSLSNVEFRDLNFDGQRLQNPSNQANELVALIADAGETISDIRFVNCYFQDAQNNFIAAYMSASTGIVRRVWADGCRFITTPAKRFTTGSAAAGGRGLSQDGLRLQQTWDQTGTFHGSGYATPQYFDCRMTGCYGESIRTLCDFKRGGKNLFMGAGCIAVNMGDTYFSCDGCFDVVFSGFTGRMETTFTGPTNNNDFVEFQVENGTVSDFTFDGNGLIRDGVWISDYGTPAENWDGGNRGHQSVGVKVFGGTVRGCTGNGYRMSNGQSCSIRDVYAENCGRSVGVESGVTHNAADGSTPLQSHAAQIGPIMSNGCTNRATIGSTAIGSRWSFSANELGQDYYDVGTTATPNGGAGTTNALSIALNAPYQSDSKELNPNPLFGASQSYYVPSGGLVVGSAGPPNGAPAAISLQDSNASGIENLQASETPLLTQGQLFFQRLSAQYPGAGGSHQWSIQVSELDSSSSVIASYYYSVTSFHLSGGGWIDYDLGHTAQNANCFKVAFQINPAAISSTDTATTGKINVANWRWSRGAIGVI